MSFVKKGLKKAWGFVKEHWVEIAIVAAVVFTAGVATIGFSAFAGGNFFAAVGQTMWAGVAGTAGSMGIGAGATVGGTGAVGSMTAAGGVLVPAGTNVGLGAAWGAGSGFGMGAAGKAAAASAAEAELVAGANLAADAALAAEGAPIVGVEGVGVGTGNAVSGEGMIAKAAAKEAARIAAAESAPGVAGGLSDAAWKTLGVAAPIVGAGLMAAGQPPDFYKTDLYASTPDGEARAGVNMLANPADVPGPDVPGPDGGTNAANAQFKNQMNRPNQSIMAPLMGGEQYV